MVIPSTIKIFDHRYRLIEQVGAGVSGEVFRVSGPDGICALKLLKAAIPGMKAEDRIAAFKFEFSLLKGFHHPNIVRILDFGFEASLKRLYFTAEWIEGKNLTNFATQASLNDLKKTFLQALQGLAYLHSQGTIHGDLKPDNLLVKISPQGEPQLKLIDFGISHPHWVGSGGTPSFMAPEKILKEKSDARSDLYSLAVVFYSALTGKNPFLQENVLKTLQAHLKLKATSATTLRPEVDPIWSELLERMLNKRPHQRPASADACLKFLESQEEWGPYSSPIQNIPHTWIGRSELLETAKDFLKKFMKGRGKTILCLAGKAGLGKRTLLTELKYEAELLGIEALSAGEKPQRPPSLFFLSQDNALNQEHLEKLPEGIGAVFIAPAENTLPQWDKTNSEIEILQLRPLTRKETLSFLKEVTRNPEIPPRFIDTLWRLSAGHPAILCEALTHLMQEAGIVEISGRWNLAVFSEVDPTLEQLGLGTATTQSLAELESNDPAQKFYLRCHNAENLAREGKLDEALTLLQKCETEIAGIFPRAAGLYERAKLFERRAWIYTKQNRPQDARESFKACLSLLKESDQSDQILEIRSLNFLAFLEMQAGRIKEAIEQFEETDWRIKALPEFEQIRITNNELGQAYIANGELEKGISQLKKDLKHFEGRGSPSLLMKIFYNLGEAEIRRKNFGEAELAYERVAELARRARDWDYLIRAYNGLGNLASLQKNFDSSLDYYQRSLNLAEYLRDYQCAATVAQNRGVILTEQGQLEKALENLELSRRLLAKISPTSHTRFLMTRATLEIGEVHRKKSDPVTAKNFFSEALHRAEEDPNLKAFRFYPLYSLAQLALDQTQLEEYEKIHPRLTHHAQDEEQKKLLAELELKAGQNRPSIEPTKRQEKSSETSSVNSGFFPREALSRILSINRALLSEQDPQALFAKILQYAAELSEAESAVLLGVGEDRSLEVLETFNTLESQEEIEISEKIAQQVLREGRAVTTADAQSDSGFNQFESVLALHLRSVACFPIRAKGRDIGLLYLTHRYRSHLFSVDTTKMLEAFTDQAGLAMQNTAYLKEMQRLNAELRQQLSFAEEEIDRLKQDLRTRVKNPYPRILGKSPAIVSILKNLDRISDTPLSVLILGETGSGKEVVARSIHENSRRRKGPFIAVNCGALPENLLESELFGYRAGAFTGALRDKKGLLEEAQEGTLLLDEIGELPLHTQVKILRALQEREIRRLGDTRPIPLDVRVLAATHRPLETWIREGKFREDLYYRVAQMVLTVPPLRERKEDIPALSEYFLKNAAKDLGLEKTPQLERHLLAKLLDYNWPGNIREFENFLRTAAAFSEKGRIAIASVPAFLLEKISKKDLTVHSQKPSTRANTHQAKNDFYRPDWKWERYEEACYAEALLKHNENAEEVARTLGVGIATVYVKIRKYQLRNQLNQWKEKPKVLPEGMSLSTFKTNVIKEAFHRLEKSPYRVADALGLNVGTIYRYAKDVNSPS